MRVSKPLLQLPIRFDKERLAAEVAALPASAWRAHPQGYAGNDAVPLVSVGGGWNDEIEGPMGPTEQLHSCPYIKDVMRELGGVWGRSRLMRLAEGAMVRPHFDVHYYWRTHLRIHIPVITNPGVQFTCAGETVHMAAGECWVFDSFAPHLVQNKGNERRVHLVLDTVGSERIWDLVDRAMAGDSPPGDASYLAEDPDSPLLFEQFNSPVVMSPWEMRQHLDYIVSHTLPHPQLKPVLKRLDRFITSWHAAWVRFGTSDTGLPTYNALLAGIREDLRTLNADGISLTNEAGLALCVEALILLKAIAGAAPSPLANASNEERPFAKLAQPFRAQSKIQKPIFIVSSPRSGSTLLFETLAKAPQLFSPGGESHAIIENVPELSVPARGWTSNRLTAEDAQESTVERLAQAFHGSLVDRNGARAIGQVRMLEKTPKNALRVPFFDAAWPDSTFVFLYRDARATLASMIEAWRSGHFATYPKLPGWTERPWSLLLVPGWQSLKGLQLHEIVARQWKTTMEVLIADLEKLPRDRVRAINYADLVAAPQATIQRLVEPLDLSWDVQLGPQLPYSRTTVSRPSPDKWRQMEQVIESVWPIVEQTDKRARAFLELINR